MANPNPASLKYKAPLLSTPPTESHLTPVHLLSKVYIPQLSLSESSSKVKLRSPGNNVKSNVVSDAIAKSGSTKSI